MMSAKRLENVTAGIARPFQTKKETNQQKYIIEDQHTLKERKLKKFPKVHLFLK